MNQVDRCTRIYFFSAKASQGCCDVVCTTDNTGTGRLQDPLDEKVYFRNKKYDLLYIALEAETRMFNFISGLPGFTMHCSFVGFVAFPLYLLHITFILFGQS